MHSPHKNAFKPANKFALNLSKVLSGEDGRTTIMIKNIPNKYSQKMLLAPLSSGAKVAFTGTKIEGCKRGQVVFVGARKNILGAAAHDRAHANAGVACQRLR